MWLEGSAGPAPGRPVPSTAHVTLLLAPNANEWTFEGTNTWLVRGATSAAVVDPGPDEQAHLEAICAELSSTGHRLDQILLTHHHRDHAAGAKALAGRTGQPCGHAAAPSRRSRSSTVRLDLDGVAVEAIATPGHTSDGFCFAVHDDRVVLTGDTVLAWVNPVISHPDGNLSDMIASLGTIRDRWTTAGQILPGHWPGVVQARTFLGTRIASRRRRTAQVRALMALGLRTPQEITTALYDASSTPA